MDEDVMMAKVWQVSGSVQRGKPVKILPWERCRDLLELDEFCRTEDRPTFQGEGSFGFFPTHVVVSFDQAEAEAHGIGPGYFLSPLDADTALDRVAAFLPDARFLVGAEEACSSARRLRFTS